MYVDFTVVPYCLRRVYKQIKPRPVISVKCHITPLFFVANEFGLNNFCDMSVPRKKCCQNMLQLLML